MSDIIYYTSGEICDYGGAFPNIDLISSNKVVFAFLSGSAGVARIGTIDPDNNTVSWGPQGDIVSDCYLASWTNLRACSVGTDIFAAAYMDDSLFDDGYTRGGKCYGTTTITFGSSKEFETGDTEEVSICYISTNKYVIGYNDESAGDVAKASICTIDPGLLSINSGTPSSYGGSNTHDPQDQSICKLDEDKFVITFRQSYNDDDDYEKGIMYAATCYGSTTPTWGSKTIFATGQASNIYCDSLDNDRFVIIWKNEDAGSNYSVRGIACQTDGTTIATGQIAILQEGENTWETCAIALDTEHVAFCYGHGSDTSGSSRIGTVDWGSLTISLGDEVNFKTLNHGSYGEIDGCKIDTNKFILGFRDGNLNSVYQIAEYFPDEEEIPAAGATKFNFVPDKRIMFSGKGKRVTIS